MMMTATMQPPPAAVDFAANLHLLADVAIAQDKAEKAAAALDTEILSLRRAAAAKLLRESRILDKFTRNLKNRDFLKMTASLMPWTPLPAAAAHKRKRETSSYSPEPINCEEENQAEEKKKKKLVFKIKTSSTNNNNNHSRPKQSPRQRCGPAAAGEMPEEFKNRIRELAGPGAKICEEKLLIEKALTMSDTLGQQARLIIPERSMHESEFLREGEKWLVRQRVGRGKLVGIDVTLVDPLLRSWSLKLKRWEMGKGEGKRSSVSYAINDGWTDVAKGLHWEGESGVGIVVQVWSVRVNGRLWLAVVTP